MTAGSDFFQVPALLLRLLAVLTMTLNGLLKVRFRGTNASLAPVFSCCGNASC